MGPRSSWFTRYSHDALAWEYDYRHNKLAPGELEWYLKYARLTGGPILELACGTGRLLIAIAQAGYRIDGLDLSGAMLRLLKMKTRDLDPNTRRRIKLYQADMRRFSTPARYPLAILAYNSLQELETRADQLLCLKNVHACLRDGGYFLLMVAGTHWDRYGDGQDYVVDWFDAPAVDVENGISVVSRNVSHLNAKARQIVRQEIFVIRRKDCHEERIELRHYVPLLTASDYRLMIESAGFYVRCYSGYDEQPEDGKSRIHCFVAQKRRLPAWQK
jgi:SAM-dependent methyltransferase